MKIAIPVWNDRISPVFDSASRLLVVEIEGRKENARFETHLHDQDVSRRCARVRDLGIHTLICGAISLPYVRGLSAGGILVLSERSGRAEDILRAYVDGNLFDPKFLMPGSRTAPSREDRLEQASGEGPPKT